MRIALAVAAVALVSCGGGARTGSGTTTPPDAAPGSESAAIAESPGTSALAGQTGGTSATAPRQTSTTRPPGPVLDGTKEAPLPPPGQGDGELDAFDRRAHLPEGAVRVASGRNAQAEWRLYAYREGKKTCLHFASQSAASGSAGGTCAQELPLDRSLATSEHGRFVYGLVTPDAVSVRAEHSDGGSETFEAVAVTGFGERFYAGELARTPLKRIVALDAGGKVVAERTDVGDFKL